MGLPINVAVKDQEDAPIVQEVVGGLAVPSSVSAKTSALPTQGMSFQCPSISNIGDIVYTPISFGYDMSTGCTLNLSREELKGLCCQGSTGCSGISANSIYSNPDNGIPYFFDANNLYGGYVGIYGNADPLDATQWFKFGISIPSSSDRNWDDLFGICRNMFSGKDSVIKQILCYRF
jgi:hypothetical protein